MNSEYMPNPFSSASQKKGKKFVASFSGGKDSMLAIYRCIKAEMIPVFMMTTCPVDASKSWFHKIDEETLFQISQSTNIPLYLIKTSPEEYGENFEKALLKALNNGAEYAVFGDIDIEEHIKWCSDRCNAVGITPYFPLWQEKRENIVREVIDSGFKAKILAVHTDKLDQSFVGKFLTDETVDKIAQCGVDVCGENGEYHTVVLDGPIYSFPIV